MLYSEKEREIIKKDTMQLELTEEEKEILEEISPRMVDNMILYSQKKLPPEEMEEYDRMFMECRMEETAREEAQERLVEKALATIETPKVQGEWAMIRREYLQYYQPQLWLEMAASGEAATHLQRIQERTQNQMMKMLDREEARLVNGKNLKFQETVQIMNQAQSAIREFLIAELSQ